MSRLACVIPYYEGHSTIVRALDSVLMSPVCDEVIVVSDGSLQPLRPLLKPSHLEFETSGRLRLVELVANSGQAAARNVGAALARSPYLCFLDQDDESLPEFHSHALAILEQAAHLAAVEGEARVVWDADGQALINEADPRYRLMLASVPWNVVVRRTAFWTCGGFPIGQAFRSEAAGEDIAFKTALRMGFATHSISTVSVCHRVRPGSATDRFLRRTFVDHAGHVQFRSRYAVEENGTLAAAMEVHVKQALRNRQSMASLLGRSS